MPAQCARAERVTGIPSRELNERLADSPSQGKRRMARRRLPGSGPGSTLFVALEKQLGLKLEKKKAGLDVLVIDHVDKVPTEN